VTPSPTVAAAATAQATSVTSVSPPASSVTDVVRRVVADVAINHAPLVRTVATGSTTTNAGAPSPGGASPATAPSGDVSDEANRASSMLSITSDLPARVTIVGAPVGTTPLRAVKRAAGRHVIGLVSIELDERLSATVDAKPASTLAVHAEFTRPVPVLRVR
jgi:hypothetical protein